MSILRANTMQNSSGNAGFSVSSKGNTLHKVSDWEIEEIGGCLYPINRIKAVYYGTGGDQTFTVPASRTHIFVKMWGAGGGQGRVGGWNYGASGGGGGHTRGLVPVTPGEVLTVRVGIGGRTVTLGSSFGGGGGSLNTADQAYGGQGGGGSYLFRGSTRLLIAGGGGAGGSSRAWEDNSGGAGGGLTGQTGLSPYDGKSNFGGGGGTQTAGGTSVGTPGSLYQGGVTNTNSYGGGGGGGFYGGGGGGYSETNTMAGGGGGSGFVSSDVLLGSTHTGSYRDPAFFWDNDLDTNSITGTTLHGYGSLNHQNNYGGNVQTGGNGLIVIYY